MKMHGRVDRRLKPPRLRDYQQYKPFLRIDFGFRCAYCQITETRWGSERNFAVEHFRPKQRFPKLALRYANLYYACNRCNEFKGDRWPATPIIRQGFYFADPCREDIYEKHLPVERDGRVNPRTRCGEYTNAHLALNRPLMVNWRRERWLFLEDVAESERVVAMLRERVVASLDGKDQQALEALIARHEQLCERLRLCY